MMPDKAVRFLLKAVGENPDREGLKETPDRVVRALMEMTAGYDQDPAKILSTTFEVGVVDEMVVLRDIHFVSLCEHHLLPFTGLAHVGYIPKDRVVGLSKLARLVQCFARRLQVQERMTNEIAHAMLEHMEPKGVGVLVEAHHSCMSCRGVRQESAVMVTSSLHGAIRDSGRLEFLKLVGK